MLTRLSSRGQLVIPKTIRQALGLRSGCQLRVRLGKGAIILEPVTVSLIDALYGKYAQLDLLAELEEEHRKELEDEKPVRS